MWVLSLWKGPLSGAEDSSVPYRWSHIAVYERKKMETDATLNAYLLNWRFGSSPLLSEKKIDDDEKHT